MKHVSFPGGNVTLGAPSNMPEGVEVEPLQVYQDEHRIAAMFHVDDDEFIELSRTRRVVVTILGSSWPPLRIDPLQFKEGGNPPPKIDNKDEVIRFLTNSLATVVGSRTLYDMTTDEGVARAEAKAHRVALDAMVVANKTFGVSLNP